MEILLRDAVCGDEDVAGVEQRPGAAQPLGGPGAVRPHHRPGTDPPGVRGVATLFRDTFTMILSSNLISSSTFYLLKERHLPEVDQPGVLVIICLNAPIHIVTSFGPLGQPAVTVGWTITF